MNGRERVVRALEFKPVDTVPKDLGGMRSTGISCFAYASLVEALGLPPRRPKVYDDYQMLALPDVDVLDALGCDVCVVEADGATNAFASPSMWQPFDSGGRLDALVRDTSTYTVGPDGAITNGTRTMVPASFVFDEEHGGQSLDLAGDLRLPDLHHAEERCEQAAPTNAEIDRICRLVDRARRSTDRAILYSGTKAGLGFPGGFPNWSMVCLTDGDFVHRYHDLITSHAAKALSRLLPHIRDAIDVILVSADDQGLQDRSILPPAVFRDLYVPYYRRVNDGVPAVDLIEVDYIGL